jgi:hypothetical protein
MTAHITPQILYVLEVYIIHELVFFTGKYSDILRDILWIAALFVFVIVAIASHGSSCRHSYTTFAVYLTGIVMSGCFLFLFILNREYHSSCALSNTCKDEKLKTNNDDHENMPTVIVS